MSQFKFQLLSLAQDSVTGYKGVITARSEYSSCPNRYALEGKCTNNEKINCEWFDEDRLEEVNK